MLGLDCPKCWEIVCECGEYYKDWDLKRLDKFIKVLQKIADGKRSSK